jgi:arylsulfatase A-like enzyme
VVAVTSDIYPTVMDILKLEVPNQVKPLDGISLLPLIDGKMKERPQPIGFWHHGETSLEDGPVVWMGNQYKLHKLGTGEFELYDIVADISEKNNIAAEHPDIVKQMKPEMEAWVKSVKKSLAGDDYPKK